MANPTFYGEQPQQQGYSQEEINAALAKIESMPSMMADMKDKLKAQLLEQIQSGQPNQAMPYDPQEWRYQDPNAAAMQQRYEQRANRFAEQQQQGFGYMGQAAQSYADAIAGKGPSIAEQQMQRGIQQAQMAAASQAASARGGGANMAAAQRLAMTQQAGMAAQGNEQAGLLRAQEVAAARQGLAQVGGTMSGQSLMGQTAYDAALDARQRYQQGLGIAYDQARTGNYLQHDATQQGMAIAQMNNQNTFLNKLFDAGLSAIPYGGGAVAQAMKKGGT